MLFALKKFPLLHLYEHVLFYQSLGMTFVLSRCLEYAKPSHEKLYRKNLKETWKELSFKLVTALLLNLEVATGKMLTK